MRTLNIDMKNLRLPIHPEVLAGILQLDDHTELNFRELDRLIRTDPALSANILKLANSSFYARGNKISSLQSAIALLGFKLIRLMTVLLTTKSMFEVGKYEKFRLYVYRHSIVASIIARSMAKRLKRPDLEEEAFVAALLHDIGKVVMNVHDRARFIESINLALNEQIPFSAAERRVFGFSHEEVGHLAAMHWQLPQLIIDTCASHEEFSAPKPGNDADLVRTIVTYADLLAKRIGYGLYLPRDQANEQQLRTLLSLDPDLDSGYLQQLDGEIEESPLFRICMSMAG